MWPPTAVRVSTPSPHYWGNPGPGIFLLLAVLVLWLTGPLAGRMAVASVAAALAVLVLFLLVFPRIRPGRGLNTALKRTSLFNLFYALLFAGVILA